MQDDPSYVRHAFAAGAKGYVLKEAADDYANSFRALWPHADFFVVNVSSPNTADLRQLQHKGALDEILAALQEANQALAGVSNQSAVISNQSAGVSDQLAGIGNRQSPRPILVKVAPDLSFEALDEILELVSPRRIAGIVATNTTVERPETPFPELKRFYAENGGLSGRPLRARSTAVIRHLHRQTQGALPIVGVGGIFNAEDAWEKITAGASLVQLYTGLVYEGPGIAKAIVRGVRERLNARGLRCVKEAVGMDSDQ